MPQPWRHPSSGIYYLRLKVPADLRPILGHEFKRSLLTKDPALARSRFPDAVAKADQAFTLAKAQAQGLSTFTRSDAEILAGRWLAKEQERLDRTEEYTDWLPVKQVHIDQHGDEHEQHGTLTEYIDGEDADWLAIVLPPMETTLREAAIPMPKDESTQFRWLVSAFTRDAARLSDWAMARFMGSHEAGLVTPTPAQALSMERKAPGPVHRLHDLFDAYAKQKVLNDGNTRAVRRTIENYRAIMDRFVELHGDLDVKAITRALVKEHRGMLARLPAKGEGIRALAALQRIEKADRENLPRVEPATISNGLRALSAVLSHGVSIQWLSENPVIASGALKEAAKAATRRKGRMRSRNDYTREELSAIFTSPIYTVAGWTPPRAKFGAAWYWVPLLLYYTGARREEVCQLRADEVRKSPEGIWYLDLMETADDDHRGVKTDSSRRSVPLHADLIARGFIDYVGGLPTGSMLFPLLEPNPAGFYGANFGKRWATYLKDVVGLDAGVSPSHGFRHTFKTLARSVNIPEDIHDAITGHSGLNSVSRGYGGMELATMARELDRFPKADHALQHS